MSQNLAILSGTGQLPLMIQHLYPNAIGVAFEGAPSTLVQKGRGVQHHRFERLGDLFDDLHAQGVTDIVMAGAMSRPKFDPAFLDSFTANVLPGLGMAMTKGDDHVLRFLIDMIEKQGFRVVGAHELVPDLTLAPGIHIGAPDETLHARDVAVGDQILKTLSPYDIGQAVVIEGGLSFGIETLQGTKALLEFVAKTDEKLRRDPRGVLVKRPKLGQDLRVDMPAIGPATVDQVHQAGLAGIVIAPNRVVVVDQPAVFQKAKELGVFIWAKDAIC